MKQIHTSVHTKTEHDPKLMFQIMFTKVLHFNEIHNGVLYNLVSGHHLNNIIDTGIVAIMSRNIFEIASLFNLILHQPNTDDERDIIHNLWRHRGLRTKKRFLDCYEATNKESNLEKEK